MKDEFSFRETPEVAEIMREAEAESRSRQLSRKSTVLSALRYTSRGSSSSSSSEDGIISQSCSKFGDSTNEKYSEVDSLFRDSHYFKGDITVNGK